MREWSGRYCQVKQFGGILAARRHRQVIDSQSLIQQNPSAKLADSAQLDSTLADYDEAIRLKPDDAAAYSNRGTVKGMLERYADALADYDEAIRLKPADAAAYSNRGLAKGKLGLKNEARKDFATALKLARVAKNADLVAKVEQLLRDLDAATGS